jgi:hypothetical protein
VGLLAPTPPPYDPLEWAKKPFAEKARMVCESWALQGYGTPVAIYAVYALKVALYVGAWAFFCSNTPGLGCGSGPLTGRYWPPVSGFLHFLRPGTIKLPVFSRWGTQRTVIDALLYLALLVLLVRALISPAPDVVPIVIVLVVLGISDRTIFLAARGEHYWTTMVCFAWAPNWIAGAKAVQLALWFWAGFSKLNQHFPTVVAVMTSNSPVLRFEWLRRRMYKHFPDDLRPSRLAVVMAHAGTALELGVPMVLAFATGGPLLVLGMVLMLMLHGYITSNVPMGVPIEWNVMVVYGAFALFWAHPEITALDVGSIGIGAFLVVMLIGLPLLGNLVPGAMSFLLAMRYYAGNWAYGVWFFRGESYRKLERLTKTSGWVYDQLDRFYDRATGVGLFGKVIAFRLMHLHGRALPVLIPKAIDRYESYEQIDGELVAGLALGWNFGDGHLHDEQLLRAIQRKCGFEPGELRCIFVEAQPFMRGTQEWRIVDAATGERERGVLDVRDMLARQPWSAT